jgi:hypothetical protein
VVVPCRVFGLAVHILASCILLNLTLRLIKKYQQEEFIQACSTQPKGVEELREDVQAGAGLDTSKSST